MALIECSECGKQVSDKANSCPNCGNPISQSKEEYLCCPKCKSRELHAEKSGFSGTKALGGALLVGGVGLLAGTIGSKDVYLTCLKCGNRFKSGEAYIDNGLSKSNELEENIISLLRQGQTPKAAQLYLEHTFPKPSMLEITNYLLKLAKDNNINIKK